jgi:small subunit ribosomal protein S9
MSYTVTTGRRKTSIARVYLKAGSGIISVNGKSVETYFPLKTKQFLVDQPLSLSGSEGQYDITINVKGGGLNGQAEACRLGITRALIKLNPETKDSLNTAGLLTRDPRMVERKKFGQKKARKSFQFSKR